MKRSSPVLPILLAVVGGCDPYSAQQGEFNAGPVDPAAWFTLHPLTFHGANNVTFSSPARDSSRKCTSG